MLTSLSVNLGVLGFFKYFDFFVESFAAVLAPLGWNPQGLNLILPIGISFYTFIQIGFLVDYSLHSLPKYGMVVSKYNLKSFQSFRPRRLSASAT